MSEAILPEWVLKIIAAAKRDRLTGFVVLNLRAGEPRHLKIEQVHFPPQAASTACPRGCGPMESKDHGTMFVCPDCGTKRTAAQLANFGANSARQSGG